MSKINWSYVSGFFDADGSIMYLSNGKGRSKKLSVCFYNNQVNILDDIDEFIFSQLGFRGNLVTKKGGSKLNYELRYFSNNALRIMDNIDTIHNKKLHRIDIYRKIDQMLKDDSLTEADRINAIKELDKLFHKKH